MDEIGGRRFGLSGQTANPASPCGGEIKRLCYALLLRLASINGIGFGSRRMRLCKIEVGRVDAGFGRVTLRPTRLRLDDVAALLFSGLNVSIYIVAIAIIFVRKSI